MSATPQFEHFSGIGQSPMSTSTQSSVLNPQSSQKYPPAILLLGPTASGKTGVALELARHLPVEIVSVDSAQIYRHMNIGTAKPDRDMLAAAPHHLIDIIEPHESYSAGQFRDDALTAMREITERGHIPLLVGGTMLYFRALLEGLAELPPADPAIRAVIDTMAEAAGWPAMHKELERLDPETAARIQPGDSQRIQRALEVYYITDKPMSELLKKPKYVYLPYRIIPVALMPSERSVLHERIAKRFEDMLELGLIGEVRWLREHYNLEPDMPSMRCVGYRQVWQYLDAEIGLTTLRETGVAATRQLAKRQLTWLRAMTEIETFDCLDENLAQRVLGRLQASLG